MSETKRKTTVYRGKSVDIFHFPYPHGILCWWHLKKPGEWHYRFHADVGDFR